MRSFLILLYILGKMNAWVKVVLINLSLILSNILLKLFLFVYESLSVGQTLENALGQSFSVVYKETEFSRKEC